MGVLDQVVQMKHMGKSEPEIIQILQSQGISPKEIQDSLSQAQIKMAISANQYPIDEMQGSIIDNPPEPEMNNYPQAYQPVQEQAIGNYPAQDPYAQNNYQQDYYPQESYSYPQETYPQETYQQNTEDSTTLIEISEQVFADKIKKVEKTLEALNEFKALNETKIEVMEDRLKRIEKTIDQLQISILDKIGSYGQNLSSIKKEMVMMQDSFGKVINPILDKKRKIL